MFGLEDQEKRQSKEFVFELEKELSDQKKLKELKKKVEDRIQEIKDILRSGKNQEDFDKLGVVLHGYAALLKVFARATAKKQ